MSLAPPEGPLGEHDRHRRGISAVSGAGGARALASRTRDEAIHPVRYEVPDDGGRIILGGGDRTKLAFGSLFGLIGAIIVVPIAAGLRIVAEELTANRRARIAAADVAERQQRA